MKKILLMISILLLLIPTGCGSSGDDKPQQGSSDSPASAEPSNQGESPSSSYQDIFNGGSYLLHYKGTVTFEGETIESDVTFATNGKDTSIVNVMEGMTAHILVKDGVTYQIDDVSKTYYAIAGADGTENVLDVSDMENVGAGNGNVDGKGLSYEEYRYGDETTRFYFDGKKLYAVSTKTPDGESMMVVLELTDKVPDSALSIPNGYKEAGGVAIPGQVPEDLQKQVDDLINDLQPAAD